ncbi:MAG: LLM class flavin-dependent oxidoreductase [Deltaproteobacteria bacterium]|nr:LLM class flavin-dependent oxidoreductase [Deltaproteobacteria bacterium]MBI3077685.1 LLM class flavin-dependent oxidoreductase [Deltaproteobacteria bacterium]
MNVELGFGVPNYLPGERARELVEIAVRAEEAGYASLWLQDRVTVNRVDTFTLLAAIAQATRRARLGTSVLLLPLRHPVHVAKAVATLDVLSGGRIILGVGIGSRADECAAVGVPFKQRASRAEEAVTVIRRIWTEERIAHQGRHYQVQDVVIGPKPVQKPGPPIWMGGSADRALDRVGRLGDGYMRGGPGKFGFPEAWAKVKAAAEKAGRNSAELARSALAYTVVDEDRERAARRCEEFLQGFYGRVIVDVRRELVVGTTEDCVRRIREYVDAGVQVPVIVPASTDPEDLDRVLALPRAVAAA